MGLEKSQNEIRECRHDKSKAANVFLKVMLRGTIRQDDFLQKKKCNPDAVLR